MKEELVTSPSGGTGPMIMEVASGKLIDLSQFTEDDVDVNDIALSLSKQCRFAGHCDRFYSVAEHAVRVCKAILDHEEGRDYETARWGLHHDDSEAYLGDVIRPLKTDSYKKTEDKVMAIIAQKLGLGGIDIPDVVKHYDNVLVATEGLHIMRNQTKDWPRKAEMAPPLDFEEFASPGWAPGQAYGMYMTTHQMLEEKINVCITE